MLRYIFQHRLARVPPVLPGGALDLRCPQGNVGPPRPPTQLGEVAEPVSRLVCAGDL